MRAARRPTDEELRAAEAVVARHLVPTPLVAAGDGEEADGVVRAAGAERRGVDERLEGRAWLAARLRDAVERTVLEVAPADEGADFAGLRIERDERALQRLGRRVGLPAPPAAWLRGRFSWSAPSWSRSAVSMPTSGRGRE